VIEAARARTTVIIVLALSLIVLSLQVVSVRPYLWPAGSGVTVSADTVFATLAEPRAVPRIRPPHLTETDLRHVIVGNVMVSGPAAAAGVTAGMRVRAPDGIAAALLEWRERYRRGPAAENALSTLDGETASWLPRPVWQSDVTVRAAWLRDHLGPILQMAAFLAGACILVALRTHGLTALLMTLALIFTAIANSGPLLGAELQLPYVGALVLAFSWTATALSFPIIGLAVLHFPSRAPLLDRHPWIQQLLPVLPAPVLVISLVAAAFLLGVDSALGPLAWFAANGWLFDASFALALGANVLIVIEGVHRYRTALDANERRRIQMVVYTGVPAVFAYAIKAGVPLVSTLFGRPITLPWFVEGLLQMIVLLPAFALPYAVAVRHVFSPRTVLRRGLQYALARRTLSVLLAMPLVALVVSLARERDRPLGDIILGQPFFYALSFALIALAWKYRDEAQRALDKKFFRAEYDAREILIALANRVPYEHDPARLVAVVMTEIDNALHPESIAVLAGGDATFDVLSAVGTSPEPLPHDSGIATMLRWSEEPLEVFLDDERSPAAKLPAIDRAWLAASRVSLLVPIFIGSGGDSQRSLMGLIVLGQKRSEEPYTPEDRRLLSGIATQMSVALDLSRLRKRASSGPAPQSFSARTSTPTVTPTMIATDAGTGPAALVMCPTCRRCFDSSDIRSRDGAMVCSDDGTFLQPVIGMPPVVDGKYRVDAVVGRGGMGAVFRARDMRLQRDVAIKVVRAELVGDPESRARFQREAQIVAQLQHPAIVTVFDFGSLADGAAFLVMEYVKGEDLRHVLKRVNRLAPPATIELVAGVAAGVDAAHRAGVLHRDLKPENVLLPESGTGPKVLDFGVAKVTDAASASGIMATQGATIIGTPAYMSPEQLRGDAIDARSDVYSLAVMTYEALTGRLPFGTGSFIDLAIKQAEGTSAVSFAGIPLPLTAPIERALSLNRENRPATAAVFAEELRLLL
jgi:predicted Ser/Thr protein kinase